MVRSSDTPEIVCLHVLVVRATLRASHQHNRAALPPNMPTNRGSPGWGEEFGDDVVAAAMIDRLVHHAEVITTSGTQSCS